MELQGYPDNDFVNNLIEGLQYGFDTGISALPEQSHECAHLLSCQGEEEFITEYLASEVDKGYLLGPFQTVPFLFIELIP